MSLPSAKRVLAKDKLVESTEKTGLFPTLVFLLLTPETGNQLAQVGSQWIEANQELQSTEENNWKLSFHLDQVNDNSTVFHHPNALPPHISLSRTVFLADVYRERFLQTLKSTTRIDYRQLKEKVQKLELFQNEESHNAFLGLVLEDGIDLVQDWIYQVDQVLKRFHLPTFYRPAVPHVTFAKSTQQNWQQHIEERLALKHPITIQVNGLYCLIGCKIYHIY